MESNREWQIGPAQPLEIEVAEDRLNAYYAENYGPLWGEENETAAEGLRAELKRLYDQHDTPDIDRIQGL